MNNLELQISNSSHYTKISLPPVILKGLFKFVSSAPRGSRLCRRATCQQ